MGDRLPQISTPHFMQSSVKFALSAKVKEELRNAISAKIIWEGAVEINKMGYYAEVHETLGPSLGRMFHTIQVSLTSR
jgi:hypothetical protein